MTFYTAKGDDGTTGLLGEGRVPKYHARMEAVSARLYAGFQAAIDASGVVVRLQHVGPRFGLYFGVREPVTNYMNKQPRANRNSPQSEGSKTGSNESERVRGSLWLLK